MFINYIDILLVFLISYLIGSIPFGLLLSFFLKKTDPRLEGSKNIGATNIARLSGWKIGLLTLILDVSKSFFTIVFFLNKGEYLNYAIISIVLGHLFPVWLKFKGGKGVAVLIGILLAYNFFIGIVFLSVWLIIAFLFKFSSLAALSACSSVLVILLLTKDAQLHTFLIILTIIFLKHKSNIFRLFSGNEAKINFKKKI